MGFSLVHPRILSHEDDVTMVCHHGLNHQDLYVTDEVYRLVAKGKAFREAGQEISKHIEFSSVSLVASPIVAISMVCAMVMVIQGLLGKDLWCDSRRENPWVSLFF